MILKWLANLFGLLKKRPILTTASRRTQPTLEHLEVRLVPATIVWDNDSGNGLASTAANWVGNNLPGAGDTIQFSGTSSTNATVDANFNLAQLQGIEIKAGYNASVDLTKDLSVNNALFEAGTLTGDGNLTIAAFGNGLWQGGTLATQNFGELIVSANASFRIETNVAHTLTKRNLSNFGKVYWIDGNLTLDGAQIHNNDNSRFFDSTAAVNGPHIIASGAADGYFKIHGDPATTIYEKTGDGETRINAEFHNDGVVKVNAGSLRLGYKSTNWGLYELNNNRTLYFDKLVGLGLHTLASANSITGTGSAEVVAGFLTTDWLLAPVSVRALTVSGTGTLVVQGQMSAEQLTIFAGSVAVNGTLTVGTFAQNVGTVSGPGTLNVSTTAYLNGGTQQGAGLTNLLANSTSFLQGNFTFERYLTNGGTLKWTAGNITLGVGGHLANHGLFRLEQGNNLQIIDASAGSPMPPSVWNDGTMVADGVVRVLHVKVTNTGNLFVSNAADLTVENLDQFSGATFLSGILRTNGKVSVWGGDVQALANSTIIAVGGVFNYGGIFSMAGAGVITLSITGDYTQGENGRYVARLIGNAHDKLAVSGNAALAGFLTVAFVGAPPANQDDYEIMTYATKSGAIPNANQNLPANCTWDPLANDGVIKYRPN